MTKWIISDLDGTLLRHDIGKKTCSIDKKTIENINIWIRKNNMFSIASGRHYKDILKILKKNKIRLSINDFIIGLNGNQIYSLRNKELIYDSLIKKEKKQNLKEIVDWILSHITNAVAFCYVKGDKIIFLRNKTNNFKDLCKKAINYEGRRGVFKIRVYDDFDDLKDIYKICIYIDENIDFYEFVDTLKNKDDSFSYFKSGPNYIEIMQKNVSKLSAIKFIINNKYISIDKKNIITIGDSGNDIEMLQFAPQSFTRYDTDDIVKKVCSKVYHYGESTFVGKIITDLLEGK